MNPAQTTSQQTRQDSPHKRADARRNHERVFAAALEVFAEFGLQGTVPQVAERAEVGKATVYRSYPSKEDLVEAVVRHRPAELERATAPVLAEAETAAAFDTFVILLFENLARDRLLSEALAEGRSTTYTGPLLDRLAVLMDAARTAGRVRPDANPLDLRVVLCGMCLQLINLAERDPALWRRYGELTLQALRP
ncbi:TetR/AcrR family transcriptional regulator [Streptomyces sp. NL15-2K]|uniref:TetR/AcrR family transcriptional regulator n=1 Tax=Streptomyces sp. NL15-2K TaxID=376149 RepID=UPI000FF924E8|nr:MULTISPECIES: TetR/AcrR family transcriptional regulator [Actinomycetes]WKX13808.1 helix-turn-helix domain-containing protein [Kutzneria buriramensis]GCB51949.1 tetR family transcriptional regulator [Streptomyces sp. NL15-2K]